MIEKLIEPKNILVTNFMNLGDVVISTGALSRLRQEYPDAKITMFVKAHSEDLFVNCPIIDDLIVFRYTSRKPGILSMYNIVEDVKSRNFDTCVFLDSKQRSALIAFLAGIPTRIGPIFLSDNNIVTPLLYTKVIDARRRRDLLEGFHQTTWFQDIVNGFTGKACCAYPVISTPTPDNHRVADSLLATLPKAEKKIGLCVKASVSLKNWPVEKFVELIERLSGKIDAAFFIVGAPGDKEYADEVVRRSSSTVANFCGKTSIMDFAALMTKSDVYVTVDTGGMHVAATTDVPIVSLFGPIPQGRVFQPLGNNSIVIKGEAPCLPCTANKRGDCQRPICMENISVDRVFEETLKALKLITK